MKALVTARLALLFARRPGTGPQERLLAALPVVSFAVVTALALIVLAGARAITALDGPNQGIYEVVTTLALALLFVPMVSLGGAAAKLATRRRDARLSSLRLLGATASQVGGLAVVEAAGGALLGAVLGTIGYAALVPVVGLLSFAGAPLGGSLWLPIWWLPVVWLIVALVAAASAALGLRSVSLTPLEVRRRARSKPARGRRAILAAALIAAGFALTSGMQTLTSVTGFFGLIVAVFVAFACGLLALDAIGPWFLKVRARLALRSAQDVEQLLAARMVLDDPLTAWRQVGGLGVTTFVGVIAAAGIGLTSIATRSALAPEELQLMTDLRTGVLVTLTIAFLMVAATVAINQAATMLDRSRVQVSLDRLGVPQQLLASAARRSVMLAVVAVVVTAAAAAIVISLPLIGASVILAPVAVATMVAVIVGGIFIVRFGASIAGALVPGILAHPDRVL